MSVIDEFGVKFVNLKDERETLKWAAFENGQTHVAVTHLIRMPQIDVIAHYLEITELAINGQFELIDDPEVSNITDIAFLTPSGVEFWDDDVQNVYEIIPLEDFREVLIAWKRFLETPPYHNHSIFSLKAWIRRF